MKKGRLTGAGGNLARKINFYDPQPPKTHSYAEKRSHRHNPAAHSRSRPTRAKRGGPSLIHRPHPTANFITSVPRQRWVPNRGKQTAAPLSSERGTGRERSFYIEKAHSARRFPLKDIACVLLAQTKDAKIVCVIAVGPDFITRTRIHTQS